MDFVVTKEILEKASDYLPIAQKTALAKEQAETCVRKSEETTGIRMDDDSVLPLPPRYFASEEARSILEMSVFTGLYLLCEETDEEGVLHMDGERYDYYAGSHIFGQLNAMKSGTFGRDNPELKTKIINMLADFNDYQKRLTAEIRNLLSLYNDPVDRFMAMNASLSTQEAMEGLLTELKDAVEAAEDYKAERTVGAE